LDEFFSAVLHDRRGSVEWAKVIELLAVNRLVAPESELGVHQRWYATTAMDVVLGTDDAVAAKDQLYRALDKALEHKEALERHLSQRWPLSYEVFEGNRADVTTLEEILDSVEGKLASWAESGSSIAGLSVKRILTCYVPEAPPTWWPLRNDF
jgi:hypothetical protein